MAKVTQFSKVKKVAATPFISLAQLAKRATAPIRANKLFRKARGSFLKSPFRGYFVESYRELKLVSWPNWKTTWKLTATVVVFSVLFAVFTTLLDVGFERIAKKIFLN